MRKLTGKNICSNVTYWYYTVKLRFILTPQRNAFGNFITQLVTQKIIRIYHWQQLQSGNSLIIRKQTAIY